MSATEDEGKAQDEEMPDAPAPSAPKQEEQEQSMIREAAIGKGAALLPVFILAYVSGLASHSLC